MNLRRAVKQNRALRWSSALALRRIPVEKWPASFARFHGLNLPRLGQAARGSPLRPPTSSRLIFRFLHETRECPGAVVECGVYRGATLVAFALYLRQNGIEKQVLGLDSFEGFGDEVKVDMQIGGEASVVKKVGGFGETSFKEVSDRVALFGLSSRVTLVPGFFKESLPGLSSLTSVSFLHLDCDLYESYKTCLDFFYPRLSPGAVVLMDEYNDPKWPGAKQAVDECLRGTSQVIEFAEADGYSKAYFVMRRVPTERA